MKRGEVWTAAGGEAYARKPRPVIILQEDRFDATESVTLCGLTTDNANAPLPRPALEPSPANGLKSPSWLMVDKITTVPKKRLGRRLGALSNDDVVRLDRAIVVVLGLATPRSRSSEVLPAS